MLLFNTPADNLRAGEPFRLILRMKNASASIAASNILFTLESEKVDSKHVIFGVICQLSALFQCSQLFTSFVATIIAYSVATNLSSPF